MTDREKVIKGFECCHVMVHNLGPDKASCEICPYKDVQTEEQIDLGGIECIAVLHDDALALLKDLEPVSVMGPDIYEEYWAREAICPDCGTHWMSYGEDWKRVTKYCPGCRRPVKWQ